MPAPAQTITIARTEPHIATAALRGFQPFSADPEKQQRYLTYLHSQTGGGGAALEPLPRQSVEEFNRETGGYARAAEAFKPMSGAMASRFRVGAVVDSGMDVREGLHQPLADEDAGGAGTPDPEGEKGKGKEEEKESEKEKTPKAHAASMGMYGVLTREVSVWQPAGLLCKRFGVKDPERVPEAGVSSAASTTATASAAQMSEMSSTGAAAPMLLGHNGAAEGSVGLIGAGKGAGRGPRDLANVGLGEDDEQGKDTLNTGSQMPSW